MLEPAAPIRTSQGIFELGYNLFVRCEYCTYKHFKYNIQRRGKRGPRQRIEAAKPRNPGEAAKPRKPQSRGAPENSEKAPVKEFAAFARQAAHVPPPQPPAPAGPGGADEVAANPIIEMVNRLVQTGIVEGSKVLASRR